MTPPPTKLHRAVVESMVDANASALGLIVSAEHRPGILMHFERIANQAQTLMEFALGEDVEPAAVFRHDGP